MLTYHVHSEDTIHSNNNNNSLSISRVVADLVLYMVPYVRSVRPPNMSISTEVGVDDNTVAL